MTAQVVPVIDERELAGIAPSKPNAPESATSLRLLSVCEYLENERLSAVRHEYVDGHLFAMAGATPTHDRIVTNITVRLEGAFGDRPCGVYSANLRVNVSPTQYRYPDLSALCGDPAFTDENPPSLLNPALIIEVLSPSTEKTDREDKFSEYRQMDTVVDYLLVAQDQVEATHYARQSPSEWLVTIHDTLDSQIALESVGVKLTLAELYRKTPLASP